MEDDKIISCEITADTTPEEAKAMIEAAFETVRQCGGYMSYLPPLGKVEEEEVPPEVKMKRMEEAIEVLFSNPEKLEWWN